MGIILQILAAVVGGSAIVLRNSRFKKWGNLLGLLSCPLWIAMEIHYCQWWVLPVNILYVIGWGAGFWRSWIK